MYFKVHKETPAVGLCGLLPEAAVVGTDVAGVLTDAAGVPVVVADVAGRQIAEAFTALAIDDDVAQSTQTPAAAMVMVRVVMTQREKLCTAPGLDLD